MIDADAKKTPPAVLMSANEFIFKGTYCLSFHYYIISNNSNPISVIGEIKRKQSWGNPLYKEVSVCGCVCLSVVFPKCLCCKSPALFCVVCDWWPLKRVNE